MRIGFDIRCLDTPYRTGVGEYTAELITALVAETHPHELTLFSNAFRAVATPHWTNPNTRLISLRWPNKLLLAATLLFKQPKLDQLLAHRAGGPIDIFFSPNLNFTTLSPTTKHVLLIHDLSFIFFPDYFSPKQRWWHRLANIQKQADRANHLITLSENTKRDIINHLRQPAEKITVIPPGIPTSITKSPDTPEQVRNHYQLPPRYILFVGTIEPRKNILGLIQAFEQAASHLPHEYHLVLAGTIGYQGDIITKKITRSPLASRIKILGYVAEHHKKGLYAGASVTVYPSFYEGFGFPVLEAMATGSPVITSNRSSLPEVAAGAAHLINPHHPEELVEALKHILHDTAYRQQLIEKGTKRSRDFSWSTAAQTWLELMEKIKS